MQHCARPRAARCLSVAAQIARFAPGGLALSCLALSGLSAAAAASEAWPARPIRLIVPFAPGGGTDMVGRAIAPRMAERLGRPVIVAKLTATKAAQPASVCGGFQV